MTPERNLTLTKAQQFVETIYDTFVAAAEAHEPVPSLHELRRRLKTSRAVIKEARTMLEADGRIVVRFMSKKVQVQITASGKWTPLAVSIPFQSKERPPDTRQERKCLRCGQTFLSHGPGNRLCCGQRGEGTDLLGQPTIYW